MIIYFPFQVFPISLLIYFMHSAELLLPYIFQVKIEFGEFTSLSKWVFVLAYLMSLRAY